MRTMNNQFRFGAPSISPATWARAAAFCGGATEYFEVQDERVRAAILGAGELAFGVAGNEKRSERSLMSLSAKLGA